MSLIKYYLPMKKIIILLLYISSISCSAQHIVPLNTSTYNLETNSYLKDQNNKLDSYIGIWTASFQNKQIKLVIDKEIKVPFLQWSKSYFRDQVIIRYEIKDSNNNILQSTINKNFSNDIELRINSIKFIDNNTVLQLLYSGGKCNVGIGEIKLKKIDNSTFYWNYYPGTTTLNDVNCSPNFDYNIYLPQNENLVFVKQ